MTETYEPVGLMEPLLPSEGIRELDDLVVDLITKSSQLTARINSIVALAIGDLVRSMNCYYSNLIEGHHTHPRDIDRALANDYAVEPKKRALQLEAVAHINTQELTKPKTRKLLPFQQPMLYGCIKSFVSIYRKNCFGLKIRKWAKRYA